MYIVAMIVLAIGFMLYAAFHVLACASSSEQSERHCSMVLRSALSVMMINQVILLAVAVVGFAHLG